MFKHLYSLRITLVISKKSCTKVYALYNIKERDEPYFRLNRINELLKTSVRYIDLKNKLTIHQSDLQNIISH